MIINCICGKKKFKLADELMPSEGSKVRCGSCSEVWFFHPNNGNTSTNEKSYEKNLDQPIQGNIEKSSPTFENEIVSDDQSFDDSDELLPSSEKEEALKEINNQTEENISNFKIFTDDEIMPSKEEMDKNLDNFKIEREQNLNFFQKLFKKDRMREAAKALEKKKSEEITEEEQKANVARRTRLLFYLLILLTLVFSVLIVPLREDVTMAFPFLKSYFEFLIPVYENIRTPLGLK